MAAFNSTFQTDLAKPSRVVPIPDTYTRGDNESHTITVLVYDSANPSCGLMAGSVSAAVARQDGNTIPLTTGTKGAATVPVKLADGSTAQATPCTVTLKQACFDCPGQVVVVIRLVSGETITSIFVGSGKVNEGLTNSIIDPGDVITDITALIAAAEQAAEDAEEALAIATHMVRYDETQTMTSSERAIASHNVGAHKIAEVFDPTATYTQGRYVLYLGDLYRLDAASFGPGAFNYSTGGWTYINPTQEPISLAEHAYTDAEKAQARENIGAGSAEDVSDLQMTDLQLGGMISDVGHSLAAEYDWQAGTYAVGDYVMSGDKLYRCTTAIATPETWTPAHWTEVKLSGDLTDLRGALASEIGDVRINGTKNIFNDELLVVSGISQNGHAFTGKASAFNSAFNSVMIPITAKDTTRYMFSLYAVCDGSQSTSGNGLQFYFVYSDNTTALAFSITNNTTTKTKFSEPSSTTKTLAGIKITYGSAPNNIWTISDIQIEENRFATDFVPYYDGYDRVSRQAIKHIHEGYDMAANAFYTLGKYNFENAVFSSGAGIVDSNTRIASIIPCHAGDYLEITPNGLYVLIMVIESLESTSAIYTGSWDNTSRQFTAENDGYIVVHVANGSSSSQSTEITPDDYVCTINVHNTYAERTAVKQVNKEQTFNIFDSEKLVLAENWNQNSDGSYSGPLNKLNIAFGSNGYPFVDSFKSNTRYTISCFAKISGTPTGGGLLVDVVYTNSTTERMILVPNSTSDYAFFAGTSESNKTISKIVMTYGSNGGNICYIKDMQVQEGLDATFYAPRINVIDYVSRHGNKRYDVPQYWGSAIETALATIKQNERTIGQKMVEFYFITDTHWNMNARHSGEILGYMAEKSEIRHVIHGGDFYDGEETTVAKAYDMLWSVCEAFNKPSFKLHSTLGNHDNNSPQNDTDLLLTQSQLYSALHRRNEENETIHNVGAVSYFDNSNQKVRFVFVQAVWEILSADRTVAEQIINELDSSWTVIVFSHMYWTSYDNNDDPIVGEAMQDAGEWLSGLKSTASAKIACWIVGHMHSDNSTTIGDLRVISTTTDCCGQSGYSGYTMTRNTNKEQAFDCYQIDTENKNIYITRIGAGENRQYSYT